VFPRGLLYAGRLKGEQLAFMGGLVLGRRFECNKGLLFGLEGGYGDVEIASEGADLTCAGKPSNGGGLLLAEGLGLDHGKLGGGAV
jgi:hypothetical protein